jgi:hypothetical protein
MLPPEVLRARSILALYVVATEILATAEPLPHSNLIKRIYIPSSAKGIGLGVGIGVSVLVLCFVVGGCWALKKKIVRPQLCVRVPA